MNLPKEEKNFLLYVHIISYRHRDQAPLLAVWVVVVKIYVKIFRIK